MNSESMSEQTSFLYKRTQSACKTFCLVKKKNGVNLHHWNKHLVCFVEARPSSPVQSCLTLHEFNFATVKFMKHHSFYSSFYSSFCRCAVSRLAFARCFVWARVLNLVSTSQLQKQKEQLKPSWTPGAYIFNLLNFTYCLNGSCNFNDSLSPTDTATIILAPRLCCLHWLLDACCRLYFT